MGLGNPLELLGIDTRFETNLDGIVRIPAKQQLTLNEEQSTELMIVCGHNSATLRESLLRFIIDDAEKFVQRANKMFKPGIIGSFCLQTIIETDMRPTHYDVALRIWN